MLLIDISHVFWATWFAAAGKPIDHTFQATIQAVHRLADGHEYVAVCCDSGRSFRADLFAEYKANRPERDAIAYEQARRVEERLDIDGFQMFRAKGFEADDVIATLTKWATDAGHSVAIATNDKDLMQLVSDDVAVTSTRSGESYGPAAVREKFGVAPEQIRDWLTLVGDASDNVPGVKGIGPKHAAALLTTFGGVTQILAAAESGDERIKPAMRDALMTANAAGTLSLASQLVTLRYDAPIDCERVLVKRAPSPIADADFEEAEEADEGDDAPLAPMAPAGAPATPRSTPAATVATLPAAKPAKAPPSAPAPMVLRSDPNWSTALEPNTIGEAKMLAANIANGRMFSAYGSPEAIFSVILMGRSMGIDSMTSLRGFHVVEGRPTMSAQLMVAVIIKSGLAKYFRCVETTDTTCTYEAHRVGYPTPTRYTYTIEDAQRAGLVKPRGNWEKNPRAMLRARCSSELAKMDYADVITNVYAPEEFEGGDNPNVYGVAV